jgi:hypothetical protein
MDAVANDLFEIVDQPEPEVVPGCVSVCFIGADEDGDE